MPNAKLSISPLNAAIAVFLLVAVIVFLAIAGGYIAYADSTNYFDREGATGMAVVFFYAPLGGLLAGLLAGGAVFRLLSHRRRPY